MPLIELIRSDYRRYRACGARSTIVIIFFTQGFWATVVFRIFHCLTQQFGIRGLRHVFRVFNLLFQKIVEVLTGISLPPECSIGPGLYIGHMGPVIINSSVKIGANCNLSHLVTIGVGGRGHKRGCPVLGDRVYVGPGAVIFGKILIGDDVAIGAGSIVTKSIPARAVVAGNPARILSYKGSFDFVRYDGMESDSARIMAQELSAKEAKDCSKSTTEREGAIKPGASDSHQGRPGD
jgi:serine O-acetyltransferase